MLGQEGKQLAWKFQFWQREVWLQGLEVGGHQVLDPDVVMGNLTAPGRQGGSISFHVVLLPCPEKQTVHSSFLTSNLASQDKHVDSKTLGSSLLATLQMQRSAHLRRAREDPVPHVWKESSRPW